MHRLRKGDEVVVTSGNHKGARGTIERVIYDAARRQVRVVVTGVNQRVKHAKGNPQKNDPGGRIQKEQPLHVSNVALYCDDKKGPARVRIEAGENNKRQRVLHGSGRRV